MATRMDASQLLKLGAWLMIEGAELAKHPSHLPLNVIENYWTASKCRQLRWTSKLHYFLASQPTLALDPARAEIIAMPVACEIFASEMLTRSFVAVSHRWDRQLGEAHLEPIARSVMTGQHEARNRVLRMLTGGAVFSIAQMAHLNTLRRKIERWNDMLLSHLVNADGTDNEIIWELAFEQSRAIEFAEDRVDSTCSTTRQLSISLAMASLQGSIQPLLVSPSPSIDLNSKIVSAIVGCFPSALDDLSQYLPKVWRLGLEQRADQAEAQLQELLAQD
ncbi:MAG: hypothetical protein U0894_13550 [Pirellulales bacterium]